ncbi:MAG TPA: hypothetical protein PLA50_05105, partial [Bacteroidia bacterium]|nr:hypothetical protein [Bacteroidia bacterium]
MALLPLSAALPRTSRPAVAAPTKRPTGGRPNPCAVVSRPCPTERLPSPSSSPRLPRRSGGRSGDQAPPSAEPESIPCTLLAEAVARGTLPV